MALHVWEFAFTHRKLGIALTALSCVVVAGFSTSLNEAIYKNVLHDGAQINTSSVANTQQKTSQNNDGVVTQPMVFTNNDQQDLDPNATDTSSNVTIKLNLTTGSQDDGSSTGQTSQQGELNVNDVVIPIEPNKTTTKTIVDDDSKIRVRVRGRSSDTSSDNSVRITVDGSN